MSLPLTATALLLIAAGTGLYMVISALRKHRPLPKTGLAHAALALTGTVVLFAHIFTGPTDKLSNVAGLFLLLALTGGALVFALREQDRPPPMMGVAAHAIMGLTAILLLLARFIYK